MLRKNQAALQVLTDNGWKYVFCNNPQTGIVTTERRPAALGKRDLDWFTYHYGNNQFRIEVNN